MRFYATIHAAITALLVLAGAVFGPAAANGLAAAYEQDFLTVPASILYQIQEYLPENALEIADGTAYVHAGHLGPRAGYLASPDSACNCDITGVPTTVVPATVPTALGTATILTTAAETSAISNSVPHLTVGVPGITSSLLATTSVEGPSSAGVTMSDTTSSITHHLTSLGGGHVNGTGESPTSTVLPTGTASSEAGKHRVMIGVSLVSAFFNLAAGLLLI